MLPECLRSFYIFTTGEMCFVSVSYPDPLRVVSCLSWFRILGSLDPPPDFKKLFLLNLWIDICFPQLARGIPLPSMADHFLLKVSHLVLRISFYTCEISSVADPGFGAFLTPGSGILDLEWVNKQDSGSGMNIPDHISESLETIV
jgi:hypothetical protein